MGARNLAFLLFTKCICEGARSVAKWVLFLSTQIIEAQQILNFCDALRSLHDATALLKTGIPQPRYLRVLNSEEYLIIFSSCGAYKRLISASVGGIGQLSAMG